MKHYTKIFIKELDKKDIILKIEEFLREYWGKHEFLIQFPGITEKNTKVFLKDSSFNSLNFFAFQNKEHLQFLINNNLEKTPKKVEIFRFNLLEKNMLNITFYNSFETHEREKQFNKIVLQIKELINSKLPQIRISKNIVEYKHRRNDGFILIDLIPCIEENIMWENSLRIYEKDFLILYPPVKKLFEVKKDQFDWTSYNDIDKQEWKVLVQEWSSIKTGEKEQDCFIDYVINWNTEQIEIHDSLRLESNL